jgi:hypothetical protein
MRRVYLGLVVVAAIVALAGQPPLQGATIGYYAGDAPGDTVSLNVQAAVDATGNTGVAIYDSDLAAFDFSTLDVLYTARYGTSLLTRSSDIEAWVRAGGSFLIDDAMNDSGYFVGTTAPVPIGFAGSNIDIAVTNTITSGPHGVLSDTSLDGGTASYHYRYGTLPSGSTIVLTSPEIPAGTVGFYYGLDAGTVYYSSIPMWYYLIDAGPEGVRHNFNEVYLPNLLEFGVELAPARVPEPSSLVLLLSMGAVGLVAAWRRKKRPGA